MLYETCINNAFQGVCRTNCATVALVPAVCRRCFSHWRWRFGASLAEPVTSGCWVNGFSIYLFHSYCISYTLTHTVSYLPLQRQAPHRPPPILFFGLPRAVFPFVSRFSKWRLPLSPTATPWWWAGYCHVRRLCYAHPFAPLVNNLPSFLSLSFPPISWTFYHVVWPTVAGLRSPKGRLLKL